MQPDSPILRHSQVGFLTALLAAFLIFAVTSVPAFAQKGKGKPGGGDDNGGPSLPEIRYRLRIVGSVELGAHMNVNAMNNWGQVVGRSWSEEGGSRAFVYDPMRDANNAIDLNTLVPQGLKGGFPEEEGWRIRSAVDINDHMVIVGSIEKVGTEPPQIRPIAIDISNPIPVIDLLPDVGVDYSYGSQVNENGDILGVYFVPDVGYSSWTFNPGLYDGGAELPRDGIPQDMSGSEPVLVPFEGDAKEYQLNNPTTTRPAQIAGVTSDNLVFRYTLGDSAPEYLPIFELSVYPSVDINDSGTVSGRLYFPKAKKNPSRHVPFRFDQSIEELPENADTPIAFNNAGDLLLYPGSIYRDDWTSQFGYVSIANLVVGVEEDLNIFRNAHTWGLQEMNDRGGAFNSSQFAGSLTPSYGAARVMIVLQPESAP